MICGWKMKGKWYKFLSEVCSVLCFLISFLWIILLQPECSRWQMNPLLVLSVVAATGNDCKCVVTYTGQEEFQSLIAQKGRNQLSDCVVLSQAESCKIIMWLFILR